ncbi:unnamed protein product [Rhizophagus irregularis]|nr:unnamed protein product [Rhizophagus irregularis]CAB4406482.1 unnamed protein product [Rhizophagus irregularis]
MKEKSLSISLKKSNIYNELNDDDINDDDVDNMDMDELMNDLGEISARKIDDINIFESNNNSKPSTLLEIFNSQLIEMEIVKGIDFIL